MTALWNYADKVEGLPIGYNPDDRPSILFVKLGAAGDVVRTTTLLHLFRQWDIDWLVAKENKELLPESVIRNVFTDVDQIPFQSEYDQVINLEDEEVLTRRLCDRIKHGRSFGAIIDPKGKFSYTANSSTWFDMSLISRYGIQVANELKLQNRLSYQEILFSSLGSLYRGETYILPSSYPRSSLTGDIAVAPVAGKRWPMKNWSYFNELIELLSHDYQVNVLPQRETILEHLGDIANHKLVICNDSLPMHLGLGLGLHVVSFFTCTSPWEIYDYGLLTKLVSPRLHEYFYRRGSSPEAAGAIGLKEAYDACIRELTPVYK